jgi:P2-related tail formation protein
MRNAQLIEAINVARLTEQEKRTAIAALATAEKLVGAIEWVRRTLHGLGSATVVAKPSLRT